MRKTLNLLVAVLIVFPVCINGQSTIKRGQTSKTTKQTKNTRNTTVVTNKKIITSVTYGNAATADSVAVDNGSTLTSSTMASGVKLYGKSLDIYTDNAQAQTAVRDALQNSTNAKTGCLSDNSAIFIYGGNGYNSNSIPQGMLDALQYCNQNKYVVNDVAMTANGWWCVVYNGYNYRGNIPTGCNAAMKRYMDKKETILSVSISEDGNYAIVTDSHYDASNSADAEMLKSAGDRFGMIKSVCISNKGTLVVCANGIMYMNVPKNIIESLERQTFSPSVIRFTDSGTYIAVDGKGGKAWYM